jgi:hypothetical protein
MLDNGANVTVFTNDLLLESVEKNFELDKVDTANGDAQYDYTGTSHLFGKVYYDPKGKLNILDYGSMCRQFTVVGLKSDPNEPEDYFKVTVSQLMGHTIVFRRDHNDIYVTNLRSLYKSGVLTGDRHILLSKVAVTVRYCLVIRKYYLRRLEALRNSSPTLEEDLT